ncbi:MAG: hypothetical protein JSS60_07770 [Verrucomicrobia bacterium]|nr:hypothetical protein [Verrucomicrobiota bacterium]
MANNETQYATIEQIVNSSKYPFSEAQMRHLLLHRHKNGLSNSIRKIGKRLYIRLDLFEQWIESQTEARR